MTSKRFKPIGDRARWRIIYEDILVGSDFGNVITFEQLGEALGLHPVRQRQAIRSAMARASEEYIEEHGRAVYAERDVGYRIAHPSTHVVLAHRQQKRSVKALERGHALATRADLSNVDPAIRRALEMIGHGFQLQMEFNRRLDVRQRHLEEALESTRQEQHRTAADVQELKDRLRQIEDHLSE